MDQRKVVLTVVLIVSLLSNAILFLFYWPTRADTTPPFDPFEVNFNVTETSLLEAGYTFRPVDVPMLGLQRGDTLINYQFDEACSDAEDINDIRCEIKGVSDRFCMIYLDKMDSATISELVHKYDARIISDFTWRRDYNDTTWFSGSFLVQHQFSQVIFNCTIDKCYIEGKENKYELTIENSFPWRREKIEAELESRRVGTEYYQFNGLLGITKEEVGHVLFDEFDIDRTMHMRVDDAVCVDSITKVVETKKHTFMLYFVSDTLRYIHVTFGSTTRGILEHMKAKYTHDSLSTSDRFLTSQLNKQQVTASLFQDKENTINYLVIKEEDSQYLYSSYSLIVYSSAYRPQKK
ncbi:MAG: hypothetical protein HOP30_22065 [Cyclobacteriaceae bacterium]|nr:hypothetical protein [Cyclobacteriaceae bacterium]